MIVVSGIFEIHPEDRDAAVAAATTMAAASQAEEGCHAYGFWTDVGDAARFRVFEEWESLAALETHFQTPHMAEFRRALGGIRILDRSVFRYEVAGREPL